MLNNTFDGFSQPRSVIAVDGNDTNVQKTRGLWLIVPPVEEFHQPVAGPDHQSGKDGDGAGQAPKKQTAFETPDQDHQSAPHHMREIDVRAQEAKAQGRSLLPGSGFPVLHRRQDASDQASQHHKGEAGEKAVARGLENLQI